MAAVGDNNFVRYLYRGEEDEHIPRDVTHVTVDLRTTVVRLRAFYRHPNIVEVICHKKVEKIEQEAFSHCPSLRRVIMRGVTIAGEAAFNDCRALTDVECGMLEIIERWAFDSCISLRSIHLPSARIVEDDAFYDCVALTDVKFGKKLERIDGEGFSYCRSLERITIPLKDGLFPEDDIFEGCINLKHVDLVERAALHETIAALQLEGWRNYMREEIDSINHILPNAPAEGWEDGNRESGEKALVIRRWIRSVLVKIVHYQAEHQRLLNMAATTLHLHVALPAETVMNNVLPFLALPSYTSNH